MGWLKPRLGLDAALIFCLAREVPTAFALAAELYRVSFRVLLGETAERFALAAFEEMRAAIDLEEDPRVITLRSRMRFDEQGLADAMARYRARSAPRAVMIAGLDTFRGRLLDIGAGTNRIGAELVTRADDIEVVGCDIAPATEAAVGPRLKYIQLSNVGDLPVETQSFDAVLLRYSLHHMARNIQERTLTEAFRTLNPGGALIVIEDAFSMATPPRFDNALHSEFLSLPDDRSRQVLLALMDASSLFVTADVMPFTFSYRTLEEWIDLLRKIGFVNPQATYWGLPLVSVFQAPMTVARAERPRT